MKPLILAILLLPPLPVVGLQVLPLQRSAQTSPAPPAAGKKPFHDLRPPSTVFGGQRNYRLFLPPGYAASGKHYPVIYYFHGHSDRYTLEKYDQGEDTVPKIASFVANNDVIVVAVDGYVAEHYTGFYGGSPWDLGDDGGQYDFGLYFQELVAHIDSSLRTLTDHRHRATSGLSMGGFMSLYLSARLPGLIGSASSFNPGPEFHTGDAGRRVLWRPKDHVPTHTNTMVRLIRASGDYISQYHEETRAAYANAPDVDFEFRRDESPRHWATSIGETFAFHRRAFETSSLDNMPEVWNYTSAYRSFDVWDYRVETGGGEAGFTYLEWVRQGGLRVTTRRWAPDGPPLAGRKITITTAPLYRPGESYLLIDHHLATGETERRPLVAAASGRLTFTVDGGGHQVSFAGPGSGAQPPVLLPATSKDKPRIPPGKEVALPVAIYNPRGEAMAEVTVTVTSDYPTVEILTAPLKIASIGPGERIDLSSKIRARFTAGNGYFAPTRLQVKMGYDGWHAETANLDVLVAPENIPAPAAVEILDGRTLTLPVFRQQGNQGGGKSIERKLTEGRGNGNGRLEPGEEATIWVRLPQGLDPFDKNNWHRAKVYAQSEWLTEIGDIQEGKQREWTGAQERTSLIRLSEKTPPGKKIPLLLDTESWSFHYTPDVRYGTENLYQAFQPHKRHLHHYTIETSP